MASWITGHAAQLVALAASLSFMALVFIRDSAAHKSRMRNLAVAEKLLCTHLELVQRLMDEPRVPDRLKEKLILFSGSIVDDAEFLELWKKSCEAAATERPKELSAYQKDLAALYAVDADLGNTLESAVNSALHGMLLRLPQAQDHLVEYYARVANTRNASYIFASAVEHRRCVEARNKAEDMILAQPVVA